jgi:hypothetical protein
VEVPGFSNQGHHRRFSAQKRFEVAILRWLDTKLRRRAEGCNLGASQFEFFNLFKEIRVPLIGAWITAFNIVDAKLVQFLCDAELVLQRKRNIFRLTTIPECGVVK